MSSDSQSQSSSKGAAKNSEARTIQIGEAILSKNDRLAQRNRELFRSHGILCVNVLSSPGSGKTALVLETLKALTGKLRSAVLVGDLATDNDARRLAEAGVPVVQITTGTTCHLEANMIAQALRQIPINGLELLVIENVGNLVCPASFDLGEDLRAVLLSVTEGEDKPVKYPPMFQSADAVLVTKIDLAGVCEFDRALALENIRRVAPKARVFETAAKTGAGMKEWAEYLVSKKLEKARAPVPSKPSQEPG